MTISNNVKEKTKTKMDQYCDFCDGLHPDKRADFAFKMLEHWISSYYDVLETAINRADDIIGGLE